MPTHDPASLAELRALLEYTTNDQEVLAILAAFTREAYQGAAPAAARHLRYPHSEEVREAVIRYLALCERQEAVPALLAAVREALSEGRLGVTVVEGCRALAALDDTQILPELVQAYHESDGRRVLVTAMLPFEEAALPYINRLLAEDSLRAELLAALSGLGAGRLLAEIGREHPDEAVRTRARRAARDQQA